MSALAVQLFGKLCVRRAGQALGGLDARKTQDLFCYLLLHRRRPHYREALASLFWGDQPAARAKKNLRQTLWLLQAALGPLGGAGDAVILSVDADWIGLRPEADLWLDVADFEQTCAALQGVPGPELEAAQAERLRAAVQLYRGDLLDGCYEDWCLVERERLQTMLLSTLDKLVDHAAAQGCVETGLEYGWQCLRYDGARESTHRRLMRLYDIAGDRTAALRQFERCAAALDKDLGVEPSEQTVRLYERIRAGRPNGEAPTRAGSGQAALQPGESSLPELLGQLVSFRVILEDIQRQVHEDIQAVERALSGSD